MIAHVVLMKTRCDLSATYRAAFLDAFERAIREIPSVSTDFVITRRTGQNPVGRFSQRADHDIRPLRPAFSIAAVDENRPAAGAAAGFDVAPAVADHEAVPQG